MALRALKQALLAKVETTYATDALPTGAANAILVSGVKITPLVQTAIDRKVIIPYLGGMGKITVDAHVELSFDVELAASGIAGTAPGWGVLLKGCAMAEVISAGVSVAYSPVSSGEQSLTLAFTQDGILHTLKGARGTVTGKLSPKGAPMLSFKFQGLYAAPSDSAMPATTLSAFKAPLGVTAGVTTASLHGYAGFISDFSFDLGNQVVYRPLINNESVQFVDRNAKGSITLEMPTIATKDFFGIARAGTLGAFTLTHGTVAGSKIKIDAPAVQLDAPQYTAADNIVHLQMGIEFTPVTGNDELVITCL
jgi:hypothetical protein